MSQNKVICPVCPHACALTEGQVGICGARQACGGKVIDQNYGRLASVALDPIEKKPLARFKPAQSYFLLVPMDAICVVHFVKMPLLLARVRARRDGGKAHLKK